MSRSAKVGTEHVATLALLGGGLEGDGPVGRVVIAVVVGNGGGRLHLVLNDAARAVVIVVDHNHVGHGSGYLEAVFVFNQDDVLALETGDTPAADFAQKAYFVSYLHKSVLYRVRV